MRLFNHISKNISYEDIIQLDGSFSTVHIGYKKKLFFNNKTISHIPGKYKLKKKNESLDDIISRMYSFKGVEEAYSKEENIELWKNYWLEYVNAFNNISKFLPNSVATLFIGRHTIELGLKYLLLLKGEKDIYTHNLGDLSKRLVKTYDIKDEYMNYVCDYCILYSTYIEGDNVEYFRYPNYLKKKQFCYNRKNCTRNNI